jgi:hypothetical protein
VRRHLLNLATAASAVLALAALALWVTGLFAAPRVDYAHRDPGRGVFSGWVVNSFAGQIGIYRTRSWGQRLAGQKGTSWHWYAVPLRYVPIRDRLGLVAPSYEYRDKPIADETALRFWGLTLPYWMLVLASAPLPVLRIARSRRRARRRAQSRCQTCGYDLRATPDRCPECGAVPAPPAPPTP